MQNSYKMTNSENCRFTFIYEIIAFKGDRAMASHQRRGRPKLNREALDKGTEALQQKRRALFKKGCHKEMCLTASLLGIYLCESSDL